MTALLLVVFVAGLHATVAGSRRALDAAVGLAAAAGVPTLVIGVTVVAVGTDLPEIANSVSASITGHGEVHVGNAIGSVVTQITLVMGLLCLTGRLRAEPPTVLLLGALIAAGLLLGTALLADEGLSRLDGLTLVLAWVAGSVLVARRATPVGLALVVDRATTTALGLLVGGLVTVAVGSVAVVESFTRLADRFDLPAYLTSFFVLSIGSSLPELAVDLTAVRRGEDDLAVGDLFGSSFLDATLALGLGPLIVPVTLEESVTRGGLVSVAVTVAVVAVMARSRVHGRPTGVVLLALYASLFAALIPS